MRSPPKPPLRRTKYPQLPQLLLTRLMLQTPHQPHYHSMNMCQGLSCSEGAQKWTQCSSHSFTSAKYWEIITSLVLLATLFLIQARPSRLPGTLLAHIHLAVNEHHQNLDSSHKPAKWSGMILWSKCSSWHLTLLKLIQLPSAHWSSQFRSLCKAFLLSGKSTLPSSEESSANSLRIHSIPPSRSSIKILNRTYPYTDAWGKKKKKKSINEAGKQHNIRHLFVF